MMNTWWKQYLTGPAINLLGGIKEKKHFSKPPILIGGCGRSGTTLLLSILSAHPNIHAIPVETDAFTEWDKQGSPIRIDRFYRHLLLNKIKPTAKRWCEKRPYNVRYIPEILRFFGKGAKFIHIVRDPRAVCTSVHPAKPNQYWVPIERYVDDVTMGLVHRQNPRVLTVKYEDLLSDYQSEIKRILNFVDEPFCQEMLDWYEHATLRSSNAWRESLKPLDKGKALSWKNGEHSERVEEILRGWKVKEIMKVFNYE